MSTTADVTAAVGTVKLLGQVYYISPLRDVDYGEFNRWMQQEHVKLTKDAIKGMDVEVQKALLREAIAEARKLDVTSPDALQVMTSFGGSCKLLWLSLRRRQPDLTEEELFDILEKVIEDPEEFASVMEQMDFVSSHLKKKRGTLKSRRKKRKVDRSARKKGAEMKKKTSRRKNTST